MPSQTSTFIYIYTSSWQQMTRLDLHSETNWEVNIYQDAITHGDECATTSSSVHLKFGSENHTPCINTNLYAFSK